MAEREQLDSLRADRARLVAALTEAGAVVKGDSVKCPFHDDTDPSGGIFDSDGVWRFKCFGGSCGFTGDVLDVVQHAHGCDFNAACDRLGVKGTTTSNGHGSPHQLRQSVRAVERNATPATESIPPMACEAHKRLCADPAALERLRATRGVDRATVDRFRIGVTGEPGRRYWTFPVNDSLVKAHRADGQAQKSFWSPPGGERSHLWPVNLDPTGPVWLCPGELKALAVIGCGLAAAGITSGEGNEKTPADLPGVAFEILRGREIAIAPDDDGPGRTWAEHVRRQLTDAGIDARIVKLPLDKSAGLKDMGDFIVALQNDGKGTGEIAAELTHYCEQSDPWSGTRIGELLRTESLWTPVEYISTGLRHLDHRTGGGFRTRGVHMLCGKTGQAKSQLAVTLAVNAAKSGKPVGFLSLELGRDEVAQLVAAQLGDIPRLALATGQLDRVRSEKLATVIREHARTPLHILDDERWPGGLDRDRLASIIGEGVKRFGWKMVVLDYLGLLVPSESDRDQYDTDLRHSTELKRLARKHGLALVVVAAVRKGATHRDAEQLTIDDVLGAGRLGYDSQSVLLVSREFGDADSGLVRVRPLKMRFAPCDENAGTVDLRWRPRSGAILHLDMAESKGRSGIDAVH